MTKTPASTAAMFESASEKILDEVIRQGEARMQAQLTSALAADARAGTLASVQAAGAAGLLIFAAGKDAAGAAVTGSIIAALCLMAGAICGAIALRPCKFGLVGTRPCDWVDDIAIGCTVKRAKTEHCQHLDKYLRLNEGIMKWNNRFAFGAVIALVAAPLCGFAAMICGLQR